MITSRTVLVLFIGAAATSAAAAGGSAGAATPDQASRPEARGRIEGKVIGKDGRGLGGVTIAADTLATALTDAAGEFSFDSLPAGSYRLEFALGDQVAAEPGVAVTAGSTTTVEKTVDWLPSFGGAITVVSASRKREQITEAPAAVSVVLEDEIRRRSSHGQLPKLLEFTPGIELTQNGVYDFNVNVRGINTMLTRRLLVLVDGRDPSMPLNGAQEWSSFSLPLYEIESLELVRGPSAALYGSNALHGVLSLTTKVPREHQGGRLQVAGGELDTRRIDLRHAGGLGRDWFYRLSGGHQSTSDFARSRVEQVEYGGLPLEILPPTSDQVETHFANLRIDKHFGHDASSGLLTVEGGSTQSEGVIFMTPGGRFQVLDTTTSWARFDLSTRHWNLLGTHNTRDAENIQLNSAGESFLDATRSQLELHGNHELAEGRARIVGGASYSRVTVDSKDPRGRQTLVLEEQVEDRVGIFAQLDYDLSDRLKVVAAARWDDSDRYDSEVSPKAGLVYVFRPGQRLRLTYNEAFQAPNTVEFEIFFPLGEALDLSAVEQSLAPSLGGASLGLESVPSLVLGNPSLAVERIETLELGYSGTLGGKHFLTVDAYHSELEDFVSTLLPNVGTSLGRLNPSFGPYRPPAGLTPEATAAVLAALEAELGPALFETMSNYFDGAPILATLTYANVGQVETTGLEIALSSHLSRRFRFDFSYSYIDFKIKEEVPEHPILANAPENKLSLELSYTGDAFDAAISYRWSERFDWSTGIFVGTVPSYGVVDLVADYRLGDRWTIGANITNLFDEEHFEIFGGDLLTRRALAHFSYSW